MLVILLMCVFLLNTEAVIYKLSEAQYAMMPPVVHLDSYDDCQRDAESMYCTAKFRLVSDKPNALLDMIKEYSDHQITDYDHTKLRYGICVTQTCKSFYNRENGDLRLTLEACLNQSLSEKYDLKVNILDKYHCKSPSTFKIDIDSLDIIAAIICILLLIANIGGSLGEIFLTKGRIMEPFEQRKARKLLLCFSLQRNYRKLVMPFGPGNPRLQRLQSLHGVRVLTISLMIASHAFLPCLFFIQNPQFIKELFSIKLSAIFLNGTLIMQTFLMTSSFLLVYHWQQHSEHHQKSWYLLPKIILLRWLRLTPCYAFILLLTTTWFPRLATGPLWNEYVALERDNCRQYWWQNIFYINNFFNDSRCMLQCWYLAMDFQLYVLAVIIYLACRTYRTTKMVLLTLFIVGTFIPAAIVYFKDLDGINMITPETALSLFVTNPHFHYVYKCAHTNIPGSIVGIAMGYLVYHCQTKGIRIHYQILKYRVLYWSLFPLGILCCYSGVIFYSDAPKPSVYVRTLYAAILKPLFSLIVGGIIIGCIFKIEDLYRGILEWSGWTILSRLSFSAYMLHVVIVKTYVVSLSQAVRVDVLFMATICVMFLTLTYAAAVFFYLLIEAPISNVIKEYLSTPTLKKKKTT